LLAVLNEVLLNPPGTDQPYEYIELRGTPGESLSGLAVLALEGDFGTDGSGVGQVDCLFPLDGVAIGPNGLAIIKATSGGHTVPAETTVTTSPFLDVGTTQSLENGTTSIVLVRVEGFVFQGDDIDANNDGVIDAPGITLLDSVAFANGNTSDVLYGPVTISKPPGRSEVDAATRYIDNVAPLTQAAWIGGEIADAPGLGSASVRYDPQSSNPGMPNTGAITPGAPNFGPQAVNAGAVEFATTAASFDESAGVATITVKRLLGSAGAASVGWATSDDTAIAGLDYTGSSGILNWADGDFSDRTVVVPLIDDAIPEGAESFRITLSGVSGAALGVRTAAAISISPSDQATTDVVLSEIVVNPPSSPDQPYEFVEIRGTAGTSLDNYQVVQVVGDAGSTQGNVFFKQDLTGNAIGANGHAFVGGANGHALPSGVTSIVSTQLSTGGTGLSNNVSAFLLLRSTSAFTLPADLDANNDGVLELPSGVTIVDAVGWTGTGTGTVYGGVALVTAAGTADAATRFPGNNTANSVSAWYGGDLIGTPSSTTYEGTANGRATANQPAGAVLTPGGPNFGPVTPSITSATFAFETAHQITLAGSNLQGLTSSGVTAANLTTGVNVPAANIAVAVNGAGTQAVVTFTGLTGTAKPTVLGSGNYRVTVASASFQSTPFFFQNADFTRDRKTNFDDLLILAANYNQSGKTYSQGDANYDGVVNFDDLLILAANYNATLAGTALAGTPAPLAVPPASNASDAGSADDDANDSVLA
jgi:hypothetical protein